MRRYGRAGGGSARVASSMSDTASLIYSFDSVANPNRPARPSPLASSHIQALPLDLIERLRSFPLFESTPESFLVAVGQHLRPQLHSANDYILTEGDEAKAMYWLVRGAVSVTSRDGESIYAELNPGAFFGEIGVLMDRPRTATIIARTRCLLVVLTKDDFRNILPHFPDVEQAIRDEAQERLMILEKKKRETVAPGPNLGSPTQRGSKRLRESFIEDLSLNEEENSSNHSTGSLSANKKRKSPSPVLRDKTMSSALANGSVSVRLLLKELPLFSGLPADILHFLGLNAQPRSYPPFTDIIQQNSHGREIYFIVHGEVEVLTERVSQNHERSRSDGLQNPAFEVKARLREGQYFGELVSLSLAPRRTATVRSVSAVECLMISDEILAELWKRCPNDIREQVERTAKERLELASDDDDVVMSDGPGILGSLGEVGTDQAFSVRASRRQSMPLLTLTETELDGPPKPHPDDHTVLQPSDPDPFLNVGLDNVRLRSRRGSVAPLTPDEVMGEQQRRSGSSSLHTVSGVSGILNQQRTERMAGGANCGTLPDSLLIKIFQYLDLHDLLRLRAVSLHWSSILSNSEDLMRHLDLSIYNRRITDDVLLKVICPFVGERPRYVDLSNCFHVTDEGFTKLASTCGVNVIAWKMKSVWDVTAPAILEMASRASGLQEVDLSNCRKVGDTLLARIVGWVQQGPYTANDASAKAGAKPTTQTATGAVFGCPKLNKLTLSYCKHVTDRSMHHIASHAASRIEQVDLTRCTTITDQGFQYWGNTKFSRLRKLCLADCTYLTDKAIVYLTNAAKQLEELDLSFCCALSDTATEVLALQCSRLTYLSMSFCGSAISESSLCAIGRHLLNLKHLSVRGCVRVTGAGVEAVADGCHLLESFDVSQCKNVIPWLLAGGPYKYGNRIYFETVAGDKTYR